MHALTPVAAGLAGWLALGAAGCAPLAPAPAPDFDALDSDSSGTVWGDEHPGLLVDPDEWGSTASRSLSGEVVGGTARSARVTVAADGAAARARTSPAGTFGAVEWRGDGWLRHVAAGTISPTVAEGALVGDPRQNADPRAGASVQEKGLAITTSSASWATRLGAGLVVAPRGWRAAAGGWQSADDPSTRSVFASVERRAERVLAGVAGGGGVSPRAPRAVSVFGACSAPSSFLAGEVAVAGDRVRSVARAVMGARQEWSAVAVAGAAPSGEGQLPFGAGGRWGAACERRDRWGWGTSRLSASTLTRTGAGRQTRRRRASWDGSWRVSSDARVELSARVTREAGTRGVTGPLAGPPVAGVEDEWRLRATLRARREPAPGWTVDNTYRMEWLENGSGRPGTVTTWTCTVRGAGLECRLSASAHALRSGQVAYARDPGAIDAAAFTAVSGKGAALSALARARLSPIASLGVSWAQRPPGAARALIFLTFRL